MHKQMQLLWGRPAGWQADLWVTSQAMQMVSYNFLQTLETTSYSFLLPIQYL